MKKIKVKDITATGDLETITNLYGQTAASGAVKLPYAGLRKFASNLFPIVESEWERGYVDNTGALQPGEAYIRTKNFIPILPNKKYLVNDLIFSQIIIRLYDSNMNYFSSEIGYRIYSSSGDFIFTTPSNARYYKAYLYKYPAEVLTARSIYDFGLFMTMI